MVATFGNGNPARQAGVGSTGAQPRGASFGILEEPVFSNFSFDFVNSSVSIRLIGIVTRWKKGEGFRELTPDGSPYERTVDPRVVKAFKRLLAQDAKKGNEDAKRMIEGNPELKV